MQKRSRLTWLVTIYIGFIVVWFFLRIFFFDQLWPLALLNTTAQYLFIPLPLLFIVVIWQRYWPLLLKLLIPAIIFIVLFGTLFVPPLFNTTQANGIPVTVMSFNILYSNKAHGAVVDSIQSAAPDVVGFQELTQTHAEKIVDALQAEYPYHTLESPGPWGAVGLLSRFPIESAEQFSLPPLDLALHAIINIDGSRVHVFVVHLSPNQFFDNPVSKFVPLVVERYGQRAAEVTRLHQEIAGLNEPVLLMCDCNLTDTSQAHARLNEFLNDSYKEVGWGFGHTFHPPVAPIPIQRIDYVWHSAEFVAIEAYVGQDGHSDHLPVVARLQLVETQ